MNNSGILILVLLAAIAILVFLVVEQWWKGRKAKKLSSQNLAPQAERSTPSRASIVAPAEVPIVASIKNTPVLVRKVDPFDLLKDRMREKKAGGATLSDLLPAVKSEFDDRVTTEDIFKAAADVGYAPTEIAPAMAADGYQLHEIVTLLNENVELGVEELATIVMPLAKGSTVAEKAEETIGVLMDELNFDDTDDEFFELPAKLGCSPEEAAGILFRKTELGLASVLVNLKLCGEPAVAAHIAKELDVDLSDDDEYKTLRDDGELEFSATAAILKACGQDAEDIIGTENAYNGFSSDGEDLGDIFSTLSALGFTNAEIMEGIAKADFISENVDGRIAAAALEQHIAVAEIISFLKSEDVDPDTLDDEMRDVEMDIGPRTDLLHALIHANDGVTANKA